MSAHPPLPPRRTLLRFPTQTLKTLDDTGACQESYLLTNGKCSNYRQFNTEKMLSLNNIT